MMNKRNKWLVISCTLAAALSGCGDDGDAPQSPVEPETPERRAYLDVDVIPQAKSTGKVKVGIGPYQENQVLWAVSDEAKDITGTGTLAITDAEAAGIVNDHLETVDIDLEEMARVLATNPDGLGAGSARPDIFQDGHYSAFDLLRYMAIRNDNLKLLNVAKDEAINSYTFTVAWNDGSGWVENDDWHFRFRPHGGDFTRAIGSLQGLPVAGEKNYLRIDHYWIQPGVQIVFQPFSREMTNRRHWLQHRQIERLAANNGEVIIPRLITNTSDRVFENIHVTAHNYRSDIFKPGFITAMDVFLSLGEDVDGLSFTYWDTVSTGARVGHYALNGFDGKRNSGLYGLFTEYSEADSFYDFQLPRTDTEIKCRWAVDGHDVAEDQLATTELVSDEVCKKDWVSRFSGAMVHIMPDVYPMMYGMENFYIFYGDMYAIWNVERKRHGEEITEWDFGDDQGQSDIAVLETFELPTPDSSSAPILDDSHFGWRVADCALCHNDDKNPLGHGGHSWPINSASGFEEIQPHFCASCHGSNGASEGHNETARCFWCHSGEGQLVPEKHGEASSPMLIKGEENLKGNKFVANWDGEMSIPVDAAGNPQDYSRIWTSKNSDYSASKTFPDPHSCLTCHANPNE